MPTQHVKRSDSNMLVMITEIASRHKQAFDLDDWDLMARMEEEALVVCWAYDYPVNNPNLLLASYWPER